MTRHRQCEHDHCPYNRCQWRYYDKPNSVDNPDHGAACRTCLIGTMEPRGASHGGLWATCNRPACGTSRWVAT